jgi:hypothetical protein
MSRSNSGIPYDNRMRPPVRIPARAWPSRHAVRDHTLWLLHGFGASYWQLGTTYGLNPQRVQQIVTRERKRRANAA